MRVFVAGASNAIGHEAVRGDDDPPDPGPSNRVRARSVSRADAPILPDCRRALTKQQSRRDRRFDRRGRRCDSRWRTGILEHMPTNIERDQPRGSAGILSPSQRELEEVVLELRTLVEVRMLLESRNASAEEIDSHAAEIDRLRMRLARLVKEAGDGLSSAA